MKSANHTFSIPLVLALVVGIAEASTTQEPVLFTAQNILSESRLEVIDVATGRVQRQYIKQSFRDISGVAYDQSTNTLFGYARIGSTLVEIDRQTGTFSAVGHVPFLGGGIRDLAIQPNSNALFGITLLGELVRLNKKTAEATVVGSDSQFRFAHGLAFSPDGRLFASDTRGSGSTLFEIAVETGAATAISTINRDFVVGLDFHPDGTLYGIDNLNGARGLITIDVATGEATSVGFFSDQGNRQAITFFVIPEPGCVHLAYLSGFVLLCGHCGGRRSRSDGQLRGSCR